MRVYASLSDIPATCVALPIASAIPQAIDKPVSASCLVVDVTNTKLEDGAPFIMRYGAGSDDAKMALVEAVERHRAPKPTLWVLRRPGFFFGDGPFSDPDSCEYLRSRVLGRVVGYVSDKGCAGEHDSAGTGLEIANLPLLPKGPLDPREWRIAAL